MDSYRSIVAINSTIQLTSSNKPFRTNTYYEIYGPNGEYIGKDNEYIGGNGIEYYNYTESFSVNLSDINWKIDLEDPENTNLTEEIIKQELTNEIINAHEKGTLYPDNIEIKDGIMIYKSNFNNSEPLNITGDDVISFSFYSGNRTEEHKVTFNITIPKRNINI